jgi:CheY-like chemotaxis protein
LRSVVGSGAETLRVQADAKRIKLNFDFGFRDLFANCDLHKMQRVIINLVGNAVKFTPEEGTIDISLMVDPDDDSLILIKVSDSGMGIPADLLPKLSQRYFRVGEHVRGSGLGLAISREIVELHKGTIAFASPVPGTDCGTEVSVRLPMADPPQVVLLSDDESMDDLLRKRISDSGYSLYSADSARKVIMHFRCETPSALVINKSLKDVDVQDLVFYFRDAPETKRIPIILMDYSPLKSFEVQLYRKLSVFFILLPLSGRMLENTLASAVAGDLS